MKGVKKIKVKRLIDELKKLDPEGFLYCLDPENNQTYGISGLPFEMGPRIYQISIKKSK